jgi:hypothetical protein
MLTDRLKTEHPSCGGCKKTIIGRLYSWQSEAFCATCSNVRTCPGCCKPATAVAPCGDGEVCCRCYRMLPQCAMCRCKTSYDGFYKVGDDDVCTRCVESHRNRHLGRCRCCNSFNQRCDLGYCLLCLADSVHRNSYTRFRELETEALSFLLDFEMEITGDFEVEFADTESCEREKMIGQFRSNDREIPLIVIKEGLPEPIFLATLVHELVHMWQWECCPRQSQELLEGLATWLEWKAIEEMGLPIEFSEFLKPAPAAYEIGCLRCLDMEKNLGELGLIQAVRGWEEFPLAG